MSFLLPEVLGSAVAYLLHNKVSYPSSWIRTSFHGTPVSLREGASVAGGLISSSIVTPSASASCAIAGGAIAGAIDDHFESKFSARGKGFAGHLGALKQGKITSGLMKIILVGLASAASAALIGHEESSKRCKKSSLPLKKGSASFSVFNRMTIWAERTALIALSANLINLFDLRPGRALKVSGAASLPFVCMRGKNGVQARSLIAISAVASKDDLSGATMLGDTGANALGASVGVMYARLPRAIRLIVLAGISALTLASEKISFSQVIESNRVLSRIDMWGRKPSSSHEKTSGRKEGSSQEDSLPEESLH